MLVTSTTSETTTHTSADTFHNEFMNACCDLANVMAKILIATIAPC